MPIDEERILEHLGRPDYQPTKAKGLAKQLDIDTPAYRAFRRRLRKMEEDGAVTRLKGGRYALPRQAGLITGKLEVTRRGFGFLLPDDPKREDIFVPADEMGDAFHGDRVAVRLEKRARGRDHRRYGVVDRVLERRTDRFVGTLRAAGQALLFDPEDQHLPQGLAVEPIGADGPSAKPGEKVLLEMTAWPEDGRGGCGRVVERLGPAGEPGVETAAILRSMEAPGPFPDEVMEEVRSLRAGIDDGERSRRRDCTETVCFTIDPPDARDFDDAISLEQTAEGWELGVHIADVSHYVRPGTALDAEARARSTSIYLPDRVLPMLPQELSNDICSLRPDEERPAMSVFLQLDKDGQVTASHGERTVIRSRRRLTYEEVYDLLEDGARASDFDDKDVLSRLRSLRTLTRKMRERRFRNGSVELHLPEYRILIDDDGNAEGLKLVEHDFSHQMVEDCMLAANVAMARYAAKHALGILYRIHDPPEEEDLEDMMAFLQAYGYNLRRPFSRQRLNRALQQARGTPEEHAINLAALQSMRQAVYSPDLREHFALAFPRYTHFTSPIRRYPDCHLHQTLKRLFPEDGCRLPDARLPEANRGATPQLHLLGEHCSTMERRAMKIEEEVKDLRRLELLAGSERKLHKAVVTGVRKFGVFVELEDFYIDGLLHQTELARHGLQPSEVMPAGRRKGKDRKRRKGARGAPEGFHLGQEVMVRVVEVDMAARSFRLEYAGDPRGETV